MLTAPFYLLACKDFLDFLVIIKEEMFPVRLKIDSGLSVEFFYISSQYMYR